MKITLKTESELFANFGGAIEDEFKFILSSIAGKTFNPIDFYIQGDKKVFKIDLTQDGILYSSNSLYKNFDILEDNVSSVDFEGRTYWRCKKCSMIVDADRQKDPLTGKIYSENGIQDSRCYYDLTNSYEVIQ